MSDLYKTAVLVNDPNFNLIVKAAMLKYAQSVTLGGTLTNEKNFAIWVLKNPMQLEISMVALVASDAAVLSGAVLDAGGYVDINSVQDSAVNAAVAAKWTLVSTKYPATSPM
jgi:hypothetical protein